MSVAVTDNLLSANVSGIETDATGWTAGANTTRARSTVTAQAGTASLSLTATAAGSVTVSTTARVPVVAGTEYQAYAMMANGSATAGRASVVAVDWYTASVGGTLVSTSTGASTPLAATANTWGVPAPQVTAVCPASATYAVVRITVSGLSIGAVVYADSIAMGPPVNWPGNLFPYTTSSVETDASGWAAEPNTTMAQFHTTSAWEGWYVLRMAATATGTVGAASVAAVPVTPGVEYVAYTMTRSASGTPTTVQLAVRWYDAGSALISTTTQAPWTLVTTQWDRVTHVVTPPAGAVTARLVVTANVDAAAIVYADQMGLFVAPVMPGSILTFAEETFEPAGVAWTATNGCTVARSTVRAFSGWASLLISTTGPTATVTLTRKVPVTARESYRFAPMIYKAATAASLRASLTFEWFDDANTLVATTPTRWDIGTSAGWYAPVSSALAPEGAVTVSLSIAFLERPGSETFHLDRVSFGPGGLALYAEPTDVGYGADIQIQGLTDGSYLTWSLFRVHPNGAEQLVRGTDGDLDAIPITSDRATVQDWESPLGVPVQYLARIVNGGASRGSLSLPVTLLEPPSTDVVIKDVGQPARQTTVTVQELPEWTRSARQGVHQVRGRSRPVVISDVRLARTGSLSLVTETADQRDALWWVLDEGSTLFVQWPSEWREPDVYVQVGDVAEGRLVRLAEFSDRVWTLALTEVDRPVGGMAGSPGRTWDDIATDHASWQDVQSTYTTWLHVYEGEAA